MHISYRFKHIFLIYIFFLLFWGTRFIGYSEIDYTFYGHASFIVYGLLIVFLLFGLRKLFIDRPLRYIALALLTGMLPSVVFKPFSSGESIMTEIETVKQLPLLLSFFLFHIYRVSQKDLVRLFSLFGLVVFLIQIFQLIFPENASFGIYTDDDYLKGRIGVAEERNNLLRFRLESYFVSLFCFFYYWTRLFRRFNIRTLVLFVIFAASVYLNLTRNIMLSSMLTLVLSIPMILNKGHKFKSYIVIAAVALLLIILGDILFSDFIELSNKDVDSDNIRLLSFAYFGVKIFTSPLTFLFGNGHLSESEAFETENIGLFPSDVGIVGECFYYGLIWIVIFFVTVYLLLIKYRKAVPIYIRLFIIDAMLMSPLIFPYRSGYEYIVWSAVLYLSSRSISLKRKSIHDDARH